ncbi:hypothetical protein RJ639_015361 [Escallonia herrerae]|uniref:Uncharacterized protein n=1 Tax=Escallonia herrerae TaxID=1293975 RepID=A0AA89AQ11_9ASTE|nr:hypothetical protein RJ639_015361 [Escallonia herrerae]
MAEMKDAHVVEIPVDHEHQQKLIAAMDTISAIQHHPLMEISQSPGHLLLLKLWQREEDLFGRRITIRETRIDTVKREIFQLNCFFFLFHWFFLTILFTSHVDDHTNNACRKWWIPSLLSVSTSSVIIFLVQIKLCRYWKMYGQLQREKIDNRTLTRCIQELRMKGASFDLSKEPQNAKRMKSSSVEIKWKLLSWCSQNVVTLSLVCFADDEVICVDPDLEYCLSLRGGMKHPGPIRAEVEI